MAKSVGLVLGSGGARGWAHIGVIRALTEANIPITYVAGSSIGALVGAIYTAGELDDLEELVRSLDWRTVISYFDVVFPRSGLLDGNRVYELLSDHLRDMKIEDAEIKFCCVATDLLAGKEVRLQSGAMVDAVRSSISIPGVFTPFQRGDCFLGDGGIVNPVPVDVVKDMGADIIVAVNLNPVVPVAQTLDIDDVQTDDPPSEPSAADEEEAYAPSLDQDMAGQLADEPSNSTDAFSGDRSEHQPSNTGIEDNEEQAASTVENNINSNPDTNFDTNKQTASAIENDAEGSLSLSDDEANASFVQTLRLTSSTAQSRFSTMMTQIQDQYAQMQGQVQDKLENWMPEQKQEPNIFDVIGISLNIMEQQVAKSRLEACPPDVLVEPPLSEYGIFDFHQAESIIQEGYQCMQALIPTLQELLD